MSNKDKPWAWYVMPTIVIIATVIMVLTINLPPTEVEPDSPKGAELLMSRH
jgi:hypothetical protein